MQITFIFTKKILDSYFVEQKLVSACGEPIICHLKFFTTRDMQEISGATIKIVHVGPPLRQNIQISGAPHAIEQAEELIMALFKFENPSEFSDGLQKIVVIGKLHQLLTPNSVLAKKVCKVIQFQQKSMLVT